MLYNFIRLNRSSKMSLTVQLYDGLRIGIENGNIKPGDRLLSIRAASSELGLSRTTVENAYQRLALEGYVDAIPQSGYRVRSFVPIRRMEINDSGCDIRYDFTTSGMDPDEADMDNWRKLLRKVLTDVRAMSTYGDPQGEMELREALSFYAFRSRGVYADPSRIFIGAGTGPLMQLLCPLMDRSMPVITEKPGFPLMERIFSDYGYSVHIVDSDGDYPDEEKCMIVSLPSMRRKRSADEISQDRNALLKWLDGSDDRYVLEDDYNGELRYRTRAISSFQGLAPERTIYIGSFSKLLLPSVRIAYMVLPDKLSDIASSRLASLNQSAGKTEQLALAEYITSGLLEKHLRRLRRIYARRSIMMEDVLNGVFSDICSFELLETSLAYRVTFRKNADVMKLCETARKSGILLRGYPSGDGMIMGFSSVSDDDIESGIRELRSVWNSHSLL